MKKLNFIIQAKGGVGKSLLTYLFGLTEANNAETFFVDVDSSTKTSTKQLSFLTNARVENLSLLNSQEHLMRDRLIGYLESIAATPFNEYFFDFGAPESEQLPALIFRDLPFREFLDELQFEAQFHIVISGGGSYTASTEYLSKMHKILKSEFEITAWKNIYGFEGWSSLGDELEKNCKSIDVQIRCFGDFESNSNLGAQILDQIRKGKPLSEYPIGAKLKMKQEIRQNFNFQT
ncbi:MAG: hypothetical protein V4683_02080 [Bacteroidota bacterium]